MSNDELAAIDPWVMDSSIPFIEEWRRWCRLCAKANAQYINVLSGQCNPQAILTNNRYSSFVIISAIEEFFRVQIKEDEKLSPLVCTECYHAVSSCIKFSENIKKVQQMYDELQYNNEKAHLDLQALYDKYDLFKEETTSLPTRSAEIPVEEIFIAESSSTATAKPSKFVIKNEKLSDEIPTEVLMKDFEKRDEFVDPFAEAFVQTTHSDDEAPLSKVAGVQASRVRKPTPTDEDDDSSQDDPDYNMAMDTSDEEDQPAAKKKKIKNESSDSEDSTGTNIKESKYACNICSKRFQRSGNYSVHMKKKHGVIICPQCSNSFENEASLKEHMKEHKTLFPCPHCDRKFQVKEYVAQHIKMVHDDERPFICEACGDGVRTKGQLKEHMLTHTDYSPFECKECGKCFKQKQRLKRHMQIHGEKHICTECGKQLSTRATLNSHLLVHSDKMPHKCDYCGRLFKRAKTLKNHLIAHTGIRPYSCNFCEKTFSTGPSCRFHKKTMHPVELAALEASGVKAYTRNIPNLDVLRAVTRTAENLTPLASKQNGYATFDRKKDTPQENKIETPTGEAVDTSNASNLYKLNLTL